MLKTPLEMLQTYVNQPSGSMDAQDTALLAQLIAGDFASLGFTVTPVCEGAGAPALVCTLGRGKRQLMLMGHMDTVFPHAQAVPFRDLGGGRAAGSGIADMKGGLVILLHAAARALPVLDLDAFRLCAVLNPDEEIGSVQSKDVILRVARESFAALSFEPPINRTGLVCARKGVTSVLVSCRGIPGHAGMYYREGASAIQALCAQIGKLYTLRDDERGVSFNAGIITGGTAENVIAPYAECRCEFRCFGRAAELEERIRALCAQEPVPGATTRVSFGAPHPPVDLNERSQALLDRARAIGARLGLTLTHERTGSAGDISIAAQAGIGVLDGLGLPGEQTHTAEEFAYIDELEPRIRLCARLIASLCGGADRATEL